MYPKWPLVSVIIRREKLGNNNYFTAQRFIVNLKYYISASLSKGARNIFFPGKVLKITASYTSLSHGLHTNQIFNKHMMPKSSPMPMPPTCQISNISL